MFHVQNRQRFIERTQGALAIIAGYDAMQLSGDMAAPFLQNADFWWLSGIDQPGWKIIIDGARGKTLLVRPALSAVQQTFDGSVADSEAIKLSGADALIAEEDLENELKQFARTHPRVITAENKKDGSYHVNPAQQKLKTQLERLFVRVEPCNKELAELRAIKQPAELERIKKAVKVTVDAFAAVRKNWHTYKAEYEVEADFTHAFRRSNTIHAYDPIVAAGERACTLHYHANKHTFSKRDAVVIDIGARYEGYAADITRTYCDNPSKRVIAVHQAVVSAEKAIIGLLGPDLLVSDYVKKSDEIMQDALLALGLMDKRGNIEQYRQYFPHAVSHGLGVDVHDSLGAPRYFKPGMVLTVEPGIYIPQEHLGVRIEDNIVITPAGAQNISAMLSTEL